MRNVRDPPGKAGTDEEKKQAELQLGRREIAGQSQSQPLRNTDDGGGETKHKDWH